MGLLGKVFRLSIHGGGHPTVVISDGSHSDGKVLVVNFTDADRWDDHSCVVEPGAHEAITKRSAVCYKKAKLFMATEVDRHLTSASCFRVFPDVSPELLQQIIAGARCSTDLTLKFLRYLPEHQPGQ